MHKDFPPADQSKTPLQATINHSKIYKCSPALSLLWPPRAVTALGTDELFCASSISVPAGIKKMLIATCFPCFGFSVLCNYRFWDSGELTSGALGRTHLMTGVQGDTFPRDYMYHCTAITPPIILPVVHAGHLHKWLDARWTSGAGRRVSAIWWKQLLL